MCHRLRERYGTRVLALSRARDLKDGYSSRPVLTQYRGVFFRKLICVQVALVYGCSKMRDMFSALHVLEDWSRKPLV
ncbi:hypothetical protein PHLGIDRAFT_179250 [Phlebiopsis gigantea 11061_1 CR5-6]|uniref:Uncharacterized protein n=1 Tax=Phlebiopsis gigantea (strain 11061_1 CR5-6) TaxID=745531 RepID=A0A0C3RUR4_PHLG1|nr:hypothetical protein PHLGIDRAFT_179250 [Phlebiopsis gigantea 11061_1 CR5-6]